MSTKIHKCNKCSNLVSRRNAVLCRTCANREISKNRKPRVEPRGRDRWNFKEERLEKGYVTIYDPDHIKANTHGRVHKSIVVLENKIGRKLLKNEVAHHINEIKNDDRPENLMLMTTHDHKAYHIRKNKPSVWYLLDRDKMGRFIKRVWNNGLAK